MLGNLGLDAMGRVLKKARKEGMKVFGHSYKKSIEGEADIQVANINSSM